MKKYYNLNSILKSYILKLYLLFIKIYIVIFSSSVPHDPSEIILICKFVETTNLILKISELEIFCNIIKVFTVTFEQFNVSFLNGCFMKVY